MIGASSPSSSATASTLAPRAEAAGLLVRDLEEKWQEIRELAVIPVERILDWTLWAGYNPRWVRKNEAGLRVLALAGEEPTVEEVARWKFSMERQLPQTLGQTLTSQAYQRLSWLHAREFPRAPVEMWMIGDALPVRELTLAGRSAIIYGLVGSGKTATQVEFAERLARLKDGQIEGGERSALARMLRRRGRGGTPDGEIDEDEDHNDLFYARDVRFIANYSVFDRTDDGKVIPSPIRGRWLRCNYASEVWTALAACTRHGYFPVGCFDEMASPADKFLQGAWTVKDIVFLLARIPRKLGMSLMFATQYGDKDVRDLAPELWKSARTVVRLDEPEGPMAKGSGRIVVPGTFLNGQRITGLPRPVSGFSTRDQAQFTVDVSSMAIADALADARKVAAEAGRAWTREQTATTIEAAVAAQLEVGMRPHRAVPARDTRGRESDRDAGADGPGTSAL